MQTNKCKKDAEKAPETNTDSITHDSAEINAEIVAEMLAYDPAEYLNDVNRALYLSALELRDEIIAERDAVCADLDRASAAYNDRWNGIRRREYSSVKNHLSALQAAAIVAYADRWAKYPAEARAVYRQRAEELIVRSRAALMEYMRDRDMTLDDARRIDASNTAAGYVIMDPVIAEIVGAEWHQPPTAEAWEVLSKFSDSVLYDVLTDGLQHLACAIELADGIDAVTDFVTRVNVELVRHKWTVGADNGGAGQRAPIETFAAPNNVSIMHKIMAAGMGVLTSRDVINRGRVRVDVGGNAISDLYVVCDLADADGVYIGGHLTPPQELTAEAVFTLLYEAGQAHHKPQLTDQMIFAHLPGTSRNPTPKQIDEIERSMRALRHLEITYIGAREFARKGADSAALNDTFFAYRIMPGVDQYGNDVSYYDFVGRTPIILDIALKTGQILIIPKRYIEIPGRMDDDKRYTVRCLAQRVGHINNTNERGKLTEDLARIKLDWILQATGHTGVTGTEAQRLRTFYSKVFTHFMSCGWIDGYAPMTARGRAIEKGKRGILDHYEIIPKGGRKKTYAEKRVLKKASK